MFHKHKSDSFWFRLVRVRVDKVQVFTASVERDISHSNNERAVPSGSCALPEGRELACRTAKTLLMLSANGPVCARFLHAQVNPVFTQPANCCGGRKTVATDTCLGLLCFL